MYYLTQLCLALNVIKRLFCRGAKSLGRSRYTTVFLVSSRHFSVRFFTASATCNYVLFIRCVVFFVARLPRRHFFFSNGFHENPTRRNAQLLLLYVFGVRAQSVPRRTSDETPLALKETAPAGPYCICRVTERLLRGAWRFITAVEFKMCFFLHNVIYIYIY